jgi:FG-GAP-like repeat/IPT/TIG domain/FG-GAP repeat
MIWRIGSWVCVGLCVSAQVQAVDCPWTTYPLNSNPFQVVTADFNNDGKLDLALTNNGNARVGVYLGNGSGGFSSPLVTPPLFGISHLVAADLNRDGFIDIAVNGAQIDVVTVLYGLGNGTFQSPVGFPVGDAPYGVASADFNGDGIPDLAAANFLGASISVLVGLSSGGFAPAVHYPAGNVPYDLEPGDFNEDGNPDLVVANSGSSDISVLIGLGNGGFLPQVRYFSGANPYGVAIADFDGDDIVDVVVANGGAPTIQLFKGGGAGGIGDGTFLAVTTITNIGGPRSVEDGDFDIDGLADFVVADYGGNVHLVRGLGNGTFELPQTMALDTGPTDVAVGDFDGDTRPDLAVPNYENSDLSVSLGQCLPSIPPRVLSILPTSGSAGTVVTITGQYFVEVVSVRFNAIEATFIVPSDSIIVVTVPATARTGPVSVQTVHGFTSGPVFTIAPRILSFTPRRAPIGFGSIKIRGFSFTAASAVHFNGTPAPFTVASDSLITATVPLGATDGPLSVVGPGGIGVSDSTFRIGELPSFINLSWDDCGASGVDFKSFACDSNLGNPFILVGSFVPPPLVDELQGLVAEIHVESESALPDWWKHGLGQCRGARALSATLNFGGGCPTAFQPGAAAFLGYYLGYLGPNTARIQVSVVQPSTSRGPVSPDTEYAAFHIILDRFRSTGAGSCAGCSEGVSFRLESIQLIQPAGIGYNPILSQPGMRNVVYWQSNPTTLAMIDSFMPTAGDVGTSVTILGRNFVGTTSVAFNTVAATFTVESDSVIQTEVPASGRSGPIHVTSPSGTGVSDIEFIVAPMVSGFEPQQAPIGAEVEIQGVNFTAASAVSFNNATAEFEVVSDTRILAIVPDDASDGPIAVTNPGGSDTSSEIFRIGPRLLGGINFAWNECGSAGTSNLNFACDSNSGTPLVAVASFSPMTTLPEFLGASADIRVVSSSGSLPDWWKHGAAECRGTTGLATSFDFTAGPYACTDFSSGLAAGGFAYDVGYGDPNVARLRVQYAVPFENRGQVVPGVEYYAFKVSVLRSKTTGTGACAGCEVPMCLRFDSIQLFQPPEQGLDPQLFEPLQNNVVSWQSPAVNCLLATPVLVSVVTADATSDRVRLVWQTEDVERATVHRRDAGGAWHMVATLHPDGQRRIAYEDTDVMPGVTYDYRLGVPAPAGEVFVGETRVTVPAAAPASLSMARVAWDGVALTVSLSLPRSVSAQLELFDINGRRLADERLEGLAAGDHELRVRPDQPLRPGVFFARLTQDHERVGRRVVVVQ